MRPDESTAAPTLQRSSAIGGMGVHTAEEEKEEDAAEELLLLPGVSSSSNRSRSTDASAFFVQLQPPIATSAPSASRTSAADSRIALGAGIRCQTRALLLLLPR